MMLNQPTQNSAYKVKQISTILLFFVIGLSSAFAGNQPETSTPLPVYSIDLEFLKDNSVLTGTWEESLEYRKDLSNTSPYPRVSEEAVLDFGDRRVRVYLIA